MTDARKAARVAVINAPGDLDRIMKYYDALARRSRPNANALAHIKISWSLSEAQPTPDQAIAYTRDFLAAFAADVDATPMAHAPTIVAAHGDAMHRHVHVLLPLVSELGSPYLERKRYAPAVRSANERTAMQHLGTTQPPRTDPLPARVAQAETWNGKISLYSWMRDMMRRAGINPDAIVASDLPRLHALCAAHAITRVTFANGMRFEATDDRGHKVRIKASTLGIPGAFSKTPALWDYPAPTLTRGETFADFLNSPQSLTPFARSHERLADFQAARTRTQLGYFLRRGPRDDVVIVTDEGALRLNEKAVINGADLGPDFAEEQIRAEKTSRGWLLHFDRTSEPPNPLPFTTANGVPIIGSVQLTSSPLLLVRGTTQVVIRAPQDYIVASKLHLTGFAVPMTFTQDGYLGSALAEKLGYAGSAIVPRHARLAFNGSTWTIEPIDGRVAILDEHGIAMPLVGITPITDTTVLVLGDRTRITLDPSERAAKRERTDSKTPATNVVGQSKQAARNTIGDGRSREQRLENEAPSLEQAHAVVDTDRYAAYARALSSAGASEQRVEECVSRASSVSASAIAAHRAFLHRGDGKERAYAVADAMRDFAVKSLLWRAGHAEAEAQLATLLPTYAQAAVAAEPSLAGDFAQTFALGRDGLATRVPTSAMLTLLDLRATQGRRAFDEQLDENKNPRVDPRTNTPLLREEIVHTYFWGTSAHVDERENGEYVLNDGPVDAKAVDVALLLAAQRYGGRVTLSGSSEFVRSALARAVELGIEVTNENLREAYVEARDGFRSRQQSLEVPMKEQFKDIAYLKAYPAIETGMIPLDDHRAAHPDHLRFRVDGSVQRKTNDMQVTTLLQADDGTRMLSTLRSLFDAEHNRYVPLLTNDVLDLAFPEQGDPEIVRLDSPARKMAREARENEKERLNEQANDEQTLDANWQ
ncbi:MAG: LPD7 domain-containing protein [Vulcanimicrobiaceae bacterium]